MFNIEESAFCTDHVHGVDKIYEEALAASFRVDPEASFLEIGNWKGGSAITIMQAIRDSYPERWMYTVDPYGLKPFRLKEEIQTEAKYDEVVYRDAMYNLDNFSRHYGLNHYHWRMMSEDYFKIADKVKFWYHGEPMDLKIGFAYIDGDHNHEVVEMETEWILKHGVKGMTIVYDDTPYVFEKVHKYTSIAQEKGYINNWRTYWTDIDPEEVCGMC